MDLRQERHQHLSEKAQAIANGIIHCLNPRWCDG